MNPHAALYVLEALAYLALFLAAWRGYHRLHLLAHLIIPLLALGLAAAAWEHAPASPPRIEIIAT